MFQGYFQNTAVLAADESFIPSVYQLTRRSSQDMGWGLASLIKSTHEEIGTISSGMKAPMRCFQMWLAEVS